MVEIDEENINLPT